MYFPVLSNSKKQCKHSGLQYLKKKARVLTCKTLASISA
jgi:hypothetical protein